MKHHSQDIKQGIVSFSKRDRIQALDACQFHNMLDDWSDIIHDKCLMNELQDVHVENAADEDFYDFNKIDMNGLSEFKDFFVYANYLPPGEHKYLIYCPVNQRAFVKTTLVEPNTKDHYPEFPVQISRPRRKLIKNVWRRYRKENKQFFDKAFTSTIEIPSFDITPIITRNVCEGG